MKIIKEGKSLHRVSENLPENSYKHFHEIMFNKVIELNGKLQGLSAIQLGFNKRAFIMRNPDTKEFHCVFNPKVIAKIGFRLSFEGCLSCDERYLLWRPIYVKARWFDEDNNIIERWLNKKETRIFMHEYDHLNGVTISQKGRMVPRAYYIS